MAGTVRITKRLVDAAAPSEIEQRFWDAELKGFVFRVYPNGRKTFAVKYRVGARQRWATIGEYGSPWTVDEARTRARSILRDASDGLDPQGVKEERRRAVAVNDLIELYLVEGRKSKPTKKESSWGYDASCLRRHVAPLIGKQPATLLTKADIERLQADIKAGKTARQFKTKKRGVARIAGGPIIAGGVVRSFSAMMSWAEAEGIIAVNPCKGVKTVRSSKRERYLNGDEIRQLFKAADELVEEKEIVPQFAAAIRLLALTGARRAEILELRWNEVDLERARIVLPRERSKTGEKIIPLNGASCALIKGQPKVTEFVFPGRGGKGPLIGVSHRWAAVRARAKLPGLRMHDLRHSFASFAVANGASLFLVGKALGHTQATTTERYAHLTDDPVRAVAERVAQQILGQDN
jgi:integrase